VWSETIFDDVHIWSTSAGADIETVLKLRIIEEKKIRKKKSPPQQGRPNAGVVIVEKFYGTRPSPAPSAGNIDTSHFFLSACIHPSSAEEGICS